MGAATTTGKSTDDKRHSIMRMLPRHFKILEMVVAGHKNKTIADTLGISKDTVSFLVRSPIFQTELSRRRAEINDGEIMGMDRDASIGKARSILQEASEKAAQKHVDLLETEDPSLQLRAAKEVLDRVFGKSDEKSQAQPVINVSADQIQLLTLALQESPHAQASRKDDHSADLDNGQEASSANGEGETHHWSEVGLVAERRREVHGEDRVIIRDRIAS